MRFGDYFGTWVPALLIALLLPYLLAWRLSPPNQVYLWNSYNPPDTNTYFAKMRLGWQGEWRFTLTLSPEREQHGAFLNLFYIALGHVARLTGLPLPAVYHGARLLAAMGCIMALWRLSAWILPTIPGRSWGMAFAWLGGGVGWFTAALTPPPTDVWVPEAYGFLSALTNPHFPLAQLLLISIFLLTLRWFSPERRDWQLVGLSSALVTLSLVQAFAVFTVGGVWILLLLDRWLSQRRFPWREGLLLAAVGLCGLLYPLYGVWAMQRDPVLAAWNAQNVNLSPPWWSWALGYALILPFALYGGLRLWRLKHPGGRLLVLWVAVTVLGILLPVSFQRRMSLGLSLPLGLLAGWGWTQLQRRLPRRRWGVQGLLVVLLLATPLLMLLAGFRQPGLVDYLYIPRGERVAADVLLAQEPGHTILSSPVRGSALPWLTGQRVVVGHPMETVAYQRRAAEAEAFFKGELDAAEQRELLCREAVDYVWRGALEQYRQPLAFEQFAGIRLWLQNADVNVFLVELPCDED